VPPWRGLLVGSPNCGVFIVLRESSRCGSPRALQGALLQAVNHGSWSPPIVFFIVALLGGAGGRFRKAVRRPWAASAFPPRRCLTTFVLIVTFRAARMTGLVELVGGVPEILPPAWSRAKIVLLVHRVRGRLNGELTTRAPLFLRRECNTAVRPGRDVRAYKCRCASAWWLRARSWFLIIAFVPPL